MYHDLWSAVYAHTDERLAEAIVAAAHRLLVKEGGDPAVVLAAAMLATVPKDHRAGLLKEYVDTELHAEVLGILQSDPGNKNTALVHDAILLAQYTKRGWNGDLEGSRDLLQHFRTASARADARHYLSERERDVRGSILPSATPLHARSHWVRSTVASLPKHAHLVAIVEPHELFSLQALRVAITLSALAQAGHAQTQKIRVLDMLPMREIPKGLPKPEVLAKYQDQPWVDVVSTFSQASAAGRSALISDALVSFEELLLLTHVFASIDRSAQAHRTGERSEELVKLLARAPQLRAALNVPAEKEWQPLKVYCEACLKDTRTRLAAWDAKEKITYTCACGYKNSIDLRKHGVAYAQQPLASILEATNSHVVLSSCEIPSDGVLWHGRTLSQILQVAPIDAKLDARDAVSLLGPDVLRYAVLREVSSEPLRIPHDQGILALYDDFDALEKDYFHGSATQANRELYEASVVTPAAQQIFQPRFRTIVTYVQLTQGSHDRINKVFAHEISSEQDEARLRNRIEAAKYWLRVHAPDTYRFTLTPTAHATALDDSVREAVLSLARTLAAQDERELEDLFEAIARKHGIMLSEFFHGVYHVLLGRTHGPPLSHLITIAGHEVIAGILLQVEKQRQ